MYLDKILQQRRQQLINEKSSYKEDIIKAALQVKRPVNSFVEAIIKQPLGIIAEVKKASPSKGLICADFEPVSIAKLYQSAGVAAISVLTEECYFQGSREYLKAVRNAVDIPILRKDFIFDPFQIYEARLLGADAVLLIACMLDNQTLKGFISLANELGISGLVEVHDRSELEKALSCGAKLIGINNRNLNTFEVSLSTTIELVNEMPDDCIVVSESGISSNADMKLLKGTGVSGVLIGEGLMKSDNIAKKINELREGI